MDMLSLFPPPCSGPMEPPSTPNPSGERGRARRWAVKAGPGHPPVSQTDPSKQGATGASPAVSSTRTGAGRRRVTVRGRPEE
uniref:Predicted protein n=1 Tax=Hordeum vulgare subsp. vulgare TaxID=112509 RepID=F2D7Y0_HORVV|nr:predicted protein [Hordeum vulgare subsp. vulgare]